MNKNFIIVLFFVLFASIVMAVPFTPQGDMNLRGTYSVVNASYVNATYLYQNGSQVSISTYSAGTGLSLTSTTFSLSWLYLSNFTNDLTSLDSSNIASLNWSKLQNYPSSCPSGTFISTTGDSNTCTAPTAADVDAGTFPSGDYVFSDNLTVSGKLKGASCPVKNSVFYGEDSGTLSTSAGGLTFSYGNGNTAGQGFTQLCNGSVVGMSMTCENSAASVGVVQIGLNGVAQGSGCQVTSQGTDHTGDIDTTCNVLFNASYNLAPIVTVADGSSDGCVPAFWVQYD